LNLLSFIINTNIFISLAAVFLTIETQIQLGMRPHLHPYLFIIFFATFFEYNLHKLVTVFTHPEALNSEKHKWVKQHFKLFYILVALSTVGFLFAIFLAKKQVLITLAPIALITILYSIPIFRNKRKIFRLRDIPFLKIFLIAFVWSFITIFLPVIYNNIDFNSYIIMMFAERFIFVLAIAIPFDIRDMSADLNAGIKTIPLVLGEKTAIGISNILITLFTIIIFIHYTTMNKKFLLPAFLISAISTLIVINYKKLQETRYYYTGILDGTLLIQGLLVCVFYYFPFIQF
jgi:4-hydroxybenzoate polyprenyltransferase